MSTDFYREMLEQQAIYADRARLAQQIADRNMALAELRGYLREISNYVPASTDGGGCLVHCATLIPAEPPFEADDENKESQHEHR